jgi:hypothetical protein
MFCARWTRKGVPAATSFADRLQPYVAEWASAAHEQNVVTEHRLRDEVLDLIFAADRGPPPDREEARRGGSEATCRTRLTSAAYPHRGRTVPMAGAGARKEAARDGGKGRRQRWSADDRRER